MRSSNGEMAYSTIWVFLENTLETRAKNNKHSMHAMGANIHAHTRDAADTLID